MLWGVAVFHLLRLQSLGQCVHLWPKFKLQFVCFYLFFFYWICFATSSHNFWVKKHFMYGGTPWKSNEHTHTWLYEFLLTCCVTFCHFRHVRWHHGVSNRITGREKKGEKERFPPHFHSHIHMASWINAIDRAPRGSYSPSIQLERRRPNALKGPGWLLLWCREN